MTATSFDILVIGGGVTGAGIALDAAARGLKVALIEMQGFAAGTSSRSTKLIHGGLRYLKQFEFKLVAEVGKERAIVHQNAPHLTKPEHLLLPIVEGGSLSKFTAKLGMTIYEFLAGVKKTEKHIVLSRAETIAAEPLLRKDNLLGGILFYEYRTDDARLTIEILKEAVIKGALAINYMKVVSFVYTDKKISGIKVRNQFNDETSELRSNYFVNATGPWVDEIDDLDKPQNQHKLHITKGIHIVVDGGKIPVKQSAYFDTYDKRMIFVIPREGKTYIGTTDTFYKGDIENPQVTKEDVDYLLKCVNDIFPTIHLVANDVESTWAGLRPLIQKPGKGPSEISRKDEIFESTSGLITIAGGKLTGYRKMAQRIVDLIGKKIKITEGKKIPACSTETIALSGGEVGGAAKFDTFVKNKLTRCHDLGLTASEADLLINRYGSNTDTLLNIIEKLKKQEQNPLPLILRAQIHYCIEQEMCSTPTDFFIRRTGALYFDIALVKMWEKDVLLYMKNLLAWDDTLTARFDAELLKAAQQTEVTFKV